MTEFLLDVIPRGKKLASVDIQPDLFRADATPPEGAPPSLLIPVPMAAKSGLTKTQQTFNRLVRQIESLQRDIERATVDWNGWLELYARQIHPLEVRMCASRKALLRLVIPFLEKGQKLSPRQRKTLKELVVGEFEDILDTEGELRDEDLQRVYDELTQSDSPEPEDNRFEAMRRGMEDFMQKAGVEVDLSELHPGMSADEVNAKLGELASHLKDAGAYLPWKKTKRELAREKRERELEALRAKDIGTLYRQLAKLLHPDLEQDPVRRGEKEAAMKELTTAYKANDLHALLRMEIQFITREQADATRLSDEKLSLYISVLKEQVASLKESLLTVGHHPRYSPLHRYLSPFDPRPRFEGAQTRCRLRATLQSIESFLTRLRGPNARDELLAILRASARRW
ncbi:MAG: J domain-containing protein [Limisphaerales bacterium]